MAVIDGAGGPRVPYVSWRTFWTFAEELRARGAAPQVIDNTVFGPHRSGGARSELSVALRFLGLMDENKHATEDLVELVAHPEPAKVIERLYRENYGPVFGLGLHSATVQQVDDVLDAMGAGKGDTLRKSRLFFLNGAQQAGIDVGPFLTRSTTKTKSGTRRRVAKRPPVQAATPATSVPGVNSISLDLRSYGTVRVDVSIDLFQTNDDDRAFVLELVDKVKGYGRTIRVGDANDGPD